MLYIYINKMLMCLFVGPFNQDKHKKCGIHMNGFLIYFLKVQH